MALHRIEVITGETGWRRYTEEQTFRLVEETLVPDASILGGAVAPASIRAFSTASGCG